MSATYRPYHRGNGKPFHFGRGLLRAEDGPLREFLAGVQALIAEHVGDGFPCPIRSSRCTPR